MGKYAHFEKVEPRTLEDVYARHAEVAREIHEKTARDFSGDQNLIVDLVRLSPQDPGLAAYEKMTEYAVVSVSAGYTKGSRDQYYGLYDKQNLDVVRDFIGKHEMPAYVVSVGNDGIENIFCAHVADLLGRAAITVGEATLSKDGAFVEEHSSESNPTLAGDSPFNRGERFQYIDPSPSLEGHEDLVRAKLLEWETLDRRDAYINAERSKDPLKVDVSEDFKELAAERAAKEVEAEDFINSPEMDNRLKQTMQDPTAFRQEMMNELRATYRENGLDEKGFLTGIDGTSFSGPEMAGYVTGALRIQEMRADNGLPALTKEEIISLVKMATIDNYGKEYEGKVHGIDNKFDNEAGNVLTDEAGHGVFDPQMFRALLDKAYGLIETRPDLDRQEVAFEVKGVLNPKKEGFDTLTFKLETPEDKSITVDQLRFEVNYSGLNDRDKAPDAISLERLGQEKVILTMPAVFDGKSAGTSWVRSEKQFGEVVKDGEVWEMGYTNLDEFKSDDAKVVVYGYHKGGLMDHMMQKAFDYKPKPEQDPKPDAAQEAGTAEPSPDSTNGMKMPF